MMSALPQAGVRSPKGFRLFVWREILTCMSLAFLSLSVLAQDGSKSTGPSSQPDTSKRLAVAEVDGKAIWASEVENALGAQLAQLEEQVYQLKRQRLDAMIAEKLLGQEAEQRGVTLQALLESEVRTKSGIVAEKDIETFYVANQSQIGVLDANMKERIRSYLQSQRFNVRREEFIQSLRSKAKLSVNLPLPAIRLKTSDEGAVFKGRADAPVTIVEFSDFHCPFCSKAQATLAQVLARYGDKVKLIYRHFPIDQLHPQARRAAEAAVCASDQGKFWDYHDLLYSAGADASPDRLKALAKSAGLDVPAFDQCLSSGKNSLTVQKDIDEAIRLGITGTPGFIINGRWLSGAQPLDSFIRVIEEELAQKQAAEAKRSVPIHH